MAGAQTGRTERLPTIVNPLQCPYLEDRAIAQGGTEIGRPGSKFIDDGQRGKDVSTKTELLGSGLELDVEDLEDLPCVSLDFPTRNQTGKD